MLSWWAKKRKLLYALGAFAIIALLSAYPVYQYFYEPPTCSDGVQNQEEVGVDCGGPCGELCASQVMSFRVEWSQAFSLGGGRYDLAALVENRNTDAGAPSLAYRFDVFNANGEKITERRGTTFANPEEQFLIFIGNIPLEEHPERVALTFEEVQWKAAEPVSSGLTVRRKQLVDTEDTPRLRATLANPTIYPKRDVEASAVIRNNFGNIVAVSQTFLQRLRAEESRRLPFTWPQPIAATPEDRVCTGPIDAMLVEDRSGSMNDDQINPPQPLTDAKNAAISFVRQMKDRDRVGMVSYATTASDPVDQSLSGDHQEVIASIRGIAIKKGETQHTNIADGLQKAYEEMTSPRARQNVNRAVILLTDGIASRPLDPDDPTDNTQYPRKVAREAAEALDAEGIPIYVIGLGESVRASFLSQQLATSPSHYYEALTSDELSEIYKELARVVCEEETFQTDIYVRTNVFENTEP